MKRCENRKIAFYVRFLQLHNIQVCRTIEDQQLSIILVAFFLNFHQHVLKREMHDFEVLLRRNTLGTLLKLLKTHTAPEKMLALHTRIF